MRTAALVALFCCAPAVAQTTGVVGQNDYTINGAGSGSVSCTPLAFPPGLPLVLSVTSPPGSIVTFGFSLCPCVPCSVPLLPVACPIPATACGGVTNVSADVAVFGPCPTYFTAPMPSIGSVILTLPVPAIAGFTFSTQAVIANSPCAGGNLVFSQAYSVTI